MTMTSPKHAAFSQIRLSVPVTLDKEKLPCETWLHPHITKKKITLCRNCNEACLTSEGYAFWLRHSFLYTISRSPSCWLITEAWYFLLGYLYFHTINYQHRLAFSQNFKFYNTTCTMTMNRQVKALQIKGYDLAYFRS